MSSLIYPAGVRWSAAIDLNMDELPDHLVPPGGCVAILGPDPGYICNGAFVACALGPAVPPPLPRVRMTGGWFTPIASETVRKLAAAVAASLAVDDADGVRGAASALHTFVVEVRRRQLEEVHPLGARCRDKTVLRLARAMLIQPRTSFRPREAMLLCCEGHVTIVDDDDGRAGTPYEVPRFDFDGLFDSRAMRRSRTESSE